MHNFGKKARDSVSRAARHGVYIVKLLELLINEKLYDIEKAGEKNQSGGDPFVYLNIFMQWGQKISDPAVCKAEKQHGEEAGAEKIPCSKNSENDFKI